MGNAPGQLLVLHDGSHRICGHLLPLPAVLLPVAAPAPACRSQRDADKPSRKNDEGGMLGLIDNLESGIKGLRWSPKESEWGDYYEIHNYSTAGLEFKERTIAAYLEQIQPHSVWDLGANTGKFSRIASRMSIPTIAFDIYPAAVEMNYLQCA
jgi:hypothetical protein